MALFESSHYDESRLGETLPPPVHRLLTHLGAWRAFEASGPVEAYGTTSAWGGPHFAANPFMLTPYGRGWHIDRVRFDAMLAEQAEAAGVQVLRGTRVLEARSATEGWTVCLADGSTAQARFVVDATGRRAHVARKLGAKILVSDHLIAVAGFFSVEGPCESVTLVEPFPDGWWYTAGLPGDRRVVACVTDADIARRARLADLPVWRSWLRRTTGVRQTIANGRPSGPLLTRSASSQRSLPARGPDWIAVGDAASTVDPLSSQGITKAMRSGIFASYAIADHLSGGGQSGLARYESFVAREYTANRRAQAKYYAQERRWPEAEFWVRRAGWRPQDVAGAAHQLF